MSQGLRTERIRHISGMFLMLMWIAKRGFLQLLQPFGLTPPQFMTLAALAMHKEPCPMHTLTSITLHDPPTMTGIVDRLVNVGMVQRFRSQVDRRVVLVQVTAPGIDLIKQVHEKLLEDSSALYQILTDEELANIERVFAHVLLHVARFVSLPESDLDTGLSKLNAFMCDPTIQ